MLLEASIANSYSYAQRQTFSLVAAKGKELPQNIIDVNIANKHQLLRSALVYGANGSGKSNLLLSLSLMRRIVLSSASDQRGNLLGVKPFRLVPSYRDLPSEFEVIFIAEGVRYQYGFTATSTQIHEEWLYAYPKGQAQRWFVREWDENEKTYQWSSGDYLQGDKSVWQRNTRENALFLSTAVQLNSKQLQPVFDWFLNTLKFIGVHGAGQGTTAELIDTGKKSDVLKYLQAVGIEMADILVEPRAFEGERLQELPEEIKDKLIKKFSYVSAKVKTIYSDSTGELVEFSLDDESDGTQKFFKLVGPWIDVLNNGSVLFVDELSNSLHTHLIRFLIGLFNNPQTNPKNAQLIFTTHDTNQLNQELFRRDQIWFCEKNVQKATSLYPLTDFSPRKGRENIEAAYLGGRYGAIPFVGKI